MVRLSIAWARCALPTLLTGTYPLWSTKRLQTTGGIKLLLWWHGGDGVYKKNFDVTDLELPEYLLGIVNQHLIVKKISQRKYQKLCKPLFYHYPSATCDPRQAIHPRIENPANLGNSQNVDSYYYY